MPAYVTERNAENMRHIVPKLWNARYPMVRDKPNHREPRYFRFFSKIRTTIAYLMPCRSIFPMIPTKWSVSMVPRPLLSFYRTWTRNLGAEWSTKVVSQYIVTILWIRICIMPYIWKIRFVIFLSLLRNKIFRNCVNIFPNYVKVLLSTVWIRLPIHSRHVIWDKQSVKLSFIEIIISMSLCSQDRWQIYGKFIVL